MREARTADVEIGARLTVSRIARGRIEETHGVVLYGRCHVVADHF